MIRLYAFITREIKAKYWEQLWKEMQDVVQLFYVNKIEFLVLIAATDCLKLPERLNFFKKNFSDFRDLPSRCPCQCQSSQC